MKTKLIFFFLMIMCSFSLFANETKNETMNRTMNEKDFFVLFNHKINESYNKINLLNKKPNIAKLGKEELAGNEWLSSLKWNSTRGSAGAQLNTGG